MIKEKIDTFITKKDFKQWLSTTLIEHLSMPIEGTPNYTPLQYAIHKRNVDAAMVLIEDGRIELNRRCDYGYTAIQLCVALGLFSILDQLIIQEAIDLIGICTL